MCPPKPTAPEWAGRLSRRASTTPRRRVPSRYVWCRLVICYSHNFKAAEKKTFADCYFFIGCQLDFSDTMGSSFWIGVSHMIPFLEEVIGPRPGERASMLRTCEHTDIQSVRLWTAFRLNKGTKMVVLDGHGSSEPHYLLRRKQYFEGLGCVPDPHAAIQSRFYLPAPQHSIGRKGSQDCMHPFQCERLRITTSTFQLSVLRHERLLSSEALYKRQETPPHFNQN